MDNSLNVDIVTNVSDHAASYKVRDSVSDCFVNKTQLLWPNVNGKYIFQWADSIKQIKLRIMFINIAAINTNRQRDPFLQLAEGKSILVIFT